MSDPSGKDVLGKADALLRRHAAVGEDTEPVPVLTELVDAPGAEPAPVTAPATDDPAEALSREVFPRVMAQVEEHLAADLERRLAHHLAAEARTAVAAALADLRPELSRTIAAAIAEALESRQVK